MEKEKRKYECPQMEAVETKKCVLLAGSVDGDLEGGGDGGEWT